MSSSQGDDFLDVTFGYNVDPVVVPGADLVNLARLVEDVGFDLIGIQDHPYQPGFYDTWSLITYLAVNTRTISYTPNVANLGLRPPAMLAKAAASLSALLGGRIQLGVGAGAGGGPVPSMGGQDRTGKRMINYVEQSLTVMRKALDGGTVRSQSDEIQILGYRAGPVAPERIELWLGANKPRMLATVGRAADGWMSPISLAVTPQMVPPMRAIIDDAALEAGRNPVRGIYNVAGGVGTHTGRGFEGTADDWIDWLLTWTIELGFSSFIIWPTGDPHSQAEIFGNDVIPRFRAALLQERSSR